jgi:hypothetical protein
MEMIYAARSSATSGSGLSQPMYNQCRSAWVGSSVSSSDQSLIEGLLPLEYGPLRGFFYGDCGTG